MNKDINGKRYVGIVIDDWNRQHEPKAMIDALERMAQKMAGKRRYLRTEKSASFSMYGSTTPSFMRHMGD